MIGIHLCDHIIVARDGFFSFREAVRVSWGRSIKTYKI